MAASTIYGTYGTWGSSIFLVTFWEVLFMFRASWFVNLVTGRRAKVPEARHMIWGSAMFLATFWVSISVA